MPEKTVSVPPIPHHLLESCYSLSRGLISAPSPWILVGFWECLNQWRRDSCHFWGKVIKVSSVLTFFSCDVCSWKSVIPCEKPKRHVKKPTWKEVRLSPPCSIYSSDQLRATTCHQCSIHEVGCRPCAETPLVTQNGPIPTAMPTLQICEQNQYCCLKLQNLD